MALGFYDGASTPEQLARRRAELDFLASGMGRAQNVGQGVGDILRGVGVGLGRYRANKTENAGIEKANSAWSAFNPFGPSTPPPQPPAQALQVSGGAAFPNPATAGPSTPQTRLPSGMRPMGEPAMGAQASAGQVRPSIPPAVAAKPSGNWLTYANQGAIRNQPLNPKLEQSLSFLPEMGVSMKVFSGGQDANGPRRTGSHRHDDGNAGDAFFYKDGKQLDWRNPADIPVLQQIVTRAKANGVTGFGAGEGYMQPGSMHIGFGTPAVWGRGGNGANAPDWLSQAANAKYTPQGQQAPVQVASNGPIAMPASAPPDKLSQTYPASQPMQQQSQQVAQAQPQADNSKLQQLWELSQNQFLNPNQQAMAKVLLEQEMQKQDPAYKMKMEGDQLGLEKQRLEIEAMRNPKKKPIEVGGRLIDPDTYKPLYEPPADTNDVNEYGLNPIYGKDANGNLVIMQPSKSGGVKQVDLPKGITLAPGIDYLNTGTGFVPVDKRGGVVPSGGNVAPVPIDVAGKAKQDEIGAGQGKAIVAAPGDIAAADNALSILSQIENSPYLSRGTGLTSYGNAIPGTGGYDFQNLVDQAKSGAFLTAIQQMRGLGSLSNTEGATATAAVTRMNTATSEEAFLKALSDYKGVILLGKAKAEARLRKAPQAQLPMPSIPYQNGTVPEGAISDLRADPSPESQAMFDEIFGPGAAKQALGGQ